MLHMEHFTDSEKVARRVGDLIKESGVTVVWLCDETGIPRSTMLRRLNAHSAFNINELASIAAALQVPTASLVEPIAVGAEAEVAASETEAASA